MGIFPIASGTRPLYGAPGVSNRSVAIAVLLTVLATAPVLSQEISVRTEATRPNITFGITFGASDSGTIALPPGSAVSSGDPTGMSLFLVSIELALTIWESASDHSYRLGAHRISEEQFLTLAGLDPHVSTRYREESTRHVRRGVIVGGIALVAYLFSEYRAYPSVLATAAASWAAYDFLQAARRGRDFLYSYEALVIAEHINSGTPEAVALYWPNFPGRRESVHRDLGYDLRPPR